MKEFYQVRHRRFLRNVERTFLHKKRYRSIAQAEAMAIGLCLQQWEIIKVVRTAPKSKMIWVTSDGRRIPLKDMETNHIFSVLDMIFRRFQSKVMRELSYKSKFALINRGPASYYSDNGKFALINRGPAGYYPDNGNKAGWPSLLKEYSLRGSYIPTEWT